MKRITYSIGVDGPITPAEPIPPLPEMPPGCIVVIEGRARIPALRHGLPPTARVAGRRHRGVRSPAGRGGRSVALPGLHGGADSAAGGLMAAHRTKSIEERILSALGVGANLGHGPLTATQLHTRPGLTGRLYGEIEAACETMVRGGDLARIEEWTPRGHRVSYCSRSSADKDLSKGGDYGAPETATGD